MQPFRRRLRQSPTRTAHSTASSKPASCKLLASLRLSRRRPHGANAMAVQPPPPRPADALKGLAREIENSIHFYEGLSGPFPFQKLSVSQIPGTFGQGWPGLLYLSTYSYLPAEAQHRAGLSISGQEHFSELVPFHEVAHQWWGNIVGWDSYRDQWIDEAMANYLALLFADTQKHTDHSLHIWLTSLSRQSRRKNPRHRSVPSPTSAHSNSATASTPRNRLSASNK